MGYKLHSDHKGVDEVKIFTAIRYKQSDLSGDEWRVSAIAQFYIKGYLLHESCWSDIENAWQHAWSDFIMNCEKGNIKIVDWHSKKCFQQGCKNDATWKATIKQEYCVGGGNCGAKKEYNSLIGKQHRLFCDKHKTRGDSDLEDSNDNYEFEAFG